MQYGNAETIPLGQYGFQYSVFDWSLVAFVAATVLLLVAIGIEWHGGSRRRNQEAEARECEARRDYLAEREAERQNRRDILQIRYQLNPSPTNRAALRDFLAVLEEDR